MFAIRESKFKVNDEMVDTFRRTVPGGGTTILAEAGTTEYLGGDDREPGGFQLI